MHFNLEHARKCVEESGETLASSRVRLDELATARDGLLHRADSLDTDMLDVNARMRIDERIADAQVDVEKLAGDEQSILEHIGCQLRCESDLLDLSNDAVSDIRTSVERSNLQHGKEALLGQLDTHEQQLAAVREDIQRTLHDVDSLLDELSSTPLPIDSCNPDGERRRAALEHLTDAADALNDFEGYVLSGADEALQASCHLGSIPATGDPSFDAAMESYVSERASVSYAMSSIGKTRFDSIREDIEATTETVDTIGSLTSGVLAAAAGVSLLSSHMKGKSAREGGR